MKLIKTILLILIIISLKACNLDIIQKDYSDYTKALNDDFNGNGYIPEELFKKSIIEIRLISNLDSQEYLVKYSYSDSTDWISFMELLSPCQLNFTEPKSFDVPNWWNFSLDSTIQFCYQGKYDKEFIFAVNNQKRTIYSWSNTD
jgi:hypothetical protein